LKEGLCASTGKDPLTQPKKGKPDPREKKKEKRGNQQKIIEDRAGRRNKSREKECEGKPTQDYNPRRKGKNFSKKGQQRGH